VVLVVEGERFPAHRVMLAARSEYFRGLLLSGMQEGSGQQEIELGEVSARAFRVVLRHLYTAELPSWGEAEGGGNDAGGGGGASGRAGNGGKSGKGKGKGKGGGGGGGQGGVAGVVGGQGEGAVGSKGLVRGVLKAADMLQAEGLLKHCLEAFRSGLTVHTAIEHLVWAHKHGPEEARELAMAYVVQHYKAIQVTEP
jgi:speckle-type POZ protein